jgi:uncharacterized spore protein YtfJ
MTALRRTIGAEHVFGEPVTHDGVTVIPVARVIGGGGAGGGESPADPEGANPDQIAANGEPRQSGAGLGFGVLARPVGAWEIRDGEVNWHPAVDRTQLLLGVLVAALLVARWIVSSR